MRNEKRLLGVGMLLAALSPVAAHSPVGVLGTRAISMSLQTTSFNDAVHVVQRIAFEIETWFSGVHDG